MNFKVEIDGVELLSDRLNKLLASVPEATAVGLDEIGTLVQGYARKSIQKHQSHGVKYKNLPFASSLPGYPPNSQTGGAGGFVNTIDMEVDKEDLSVWIGTNDLRGAYFEFGTKNMEPRPWLEASVEAKKEEIEEILTRVCKEALGA